MTARDLMRVVVNADDFGLTAGVNKAVARCFEAGSVSSATLVVGGDAAEDAAELAGSLPGLGVGLHFNLTLGHPLRDADRVASLVGVDGSFASRSRLLIRWLLGTLDRAEIRSEFEAQADRFRDLWPEMTHVDSHQHVHMIPQVYAVVSDYCRKNRLPMRVPWVDNTHRMSPIFVRGIRMKLLEELIRKNTRHLNPDVQRNKGFASVFDACRSPDEVSLAVYEMLLESVDRSPFEIMVHPAIVDDSLKDLTRICGFSEQEYRILSRTSILEMTERRDICLVNYGQAFAV